MGRERGDEHVPAALRDRVLRINALDDRTPFGRRDLDIETEPLLQEVGGDRRLGVELREVGGVEQDDWLTLIARLGNQLLRLVVFSDATTSAARTGWPS
jgi:hypothetical protein